jgi:hypothetical protein
VYSMAVCCNCMVFRDVRWVYLMLYFLVGIVRVYTHFLSLSSISCIVLSIYFTLPAAIASLGSFAHVTPSSRIISLPSRWVLTPEASRSPSYLVTITQSHDYAYDYLLNSDLDLNTKSYTDSAFTATGAWSFADAYCAVVQLFPFSFTTLQPQTSSTTRLNPNSTSTQSPASTTPHTDSTCNMFNTNASTPFADDSRAQGSGRAHHTTSIPSNTRRPAISFGPLSPAVPHTSTRRPTTRPGMPFVETGPTSTQGPTIRDSLRPDRVNGVPSSRHPITGAKVLQPPGRSSEYAYLPAAASQLGRVPGAGLRGEGGSRSHNTNVQVINGLGDERSQALTHTGTSRALIQLPTIQSGSVPEPHIGGSRRGGLRVHQTRAPRGCKFTMSTPPDIVTDVPFPMGAIRGPEDNEDDDAAFWDDGREEAGGGWIQGFGPGGQHPGSGGQVFGMQQPGSRTGQLQIEGSRARSIRLCVHPMASARTMLPSAHLVPSVYLALSVQTLDPASYIHALGRREV